jgi:BirA family biotin operon repressor/biotin-[acetyl-CoA-carboxylase] ligase
MPEATVAPPLHWGAEALWAQLQPLLPGLSVEVVARSASTNSALLERARAVAEAQDRAAGRGSDALVRRSVESAAFGRRGIDLQPCLLVAERQFAGRGRQGRSWQSAAAGASLTFSLSVPLRLADWSGLSLAVGVALADALDPPGTQAPRIGLKWPNDLWLMDAGQDAPDAPPRGRKLGGILIETVAAGTQRLAVIGVGLNILPFEVAQAGSGVASVQELSDEVSAPAVLAQIARPLVLALQTFEREGFAAFLGRYAARDVLRGRPVHTTLAAAGVGAGVSPKGALLLRTPAGLIGIDSGEVSVRPVAMALPQD